MVWALGPAVPGRSKFVQTVLHLMQWRLFRLAFVGHCPRWPPSVAGVRPLPRRPIVLSTRWTANLLETSEKRPFFGSQHSEDLLEKSELTGV